jgi:microcystin-dependent protein
MSDPFLGEIRIFAGKYVPNGWAFCQGQLLSISQSSALFSLIGAIYGGDGKVTFALPNLQGNAPMHWGTGTGLTPRSLGETGGSTTILLNQNQMPSHNHLLVGVNDDADLQVPSASVALAKSVNATLYNSSITGGKPLNSAAVGLVGGGQAHNNMQQYLPLNFCIAMQGIYPQRP